MKDEVTTGSVFDDLEADPGKAEQMRIKAALFDAIVAFIEENDLTQVKAAEIMGVQRSRIGDICRGKMSGFTIDALVSMAARAGLYPLRIAA
jgi:predicted XRE-type DNA-binding protein